MILNRMVSPALTLNCVAKPSMLESSKESHSLEGAPGRAFSTDTALGAAEASPPSTPIIPTAPALAAAPFRNERRPNAPKNADPPSAIRGRPGLNCRPSPFPPYLCPGQAAPPDAT